MNDLSIYILEKLKISKDTKITHISDKFKEGEKCLFISALGSKYCIFRVEKINEIHSNKIVIKKLGTPSGDIIYEFKPDKNGDMILSNKNYPGYILNKDDGYDFLNYMYKTRKGVIKITIDGNHYRLQNPYDNRPMFVYINELIQSILD